MKTCTIDYYEPYGTSVRHYRILYMGVELCSGYQKDEDTIETIAIEHARKRVEQFTHYKTCITKPAPLYT